MQKWTLDQLQEAAQRSANAWAQIANEKFADCNIPIPVTVEFGVCETSPKTLGLAIGFSDVQLNMILLEDEPELFLNIVMPHEIAHLVANHIFMKYNISITAHGPEWREIMKMLGQDPHKFQPIDTKRAKEWHREFKKSKKETADES